MNLAPINLSDSSVQTVKIWWREACKIAGVKSKFNFNVEKEDHITYIGFENHIDCSHYPFMFIEDPLGMFPSEDHPLSVGDSDHELKTPEEVINYLKRIFK